jgi:rare lipoprotein A (peptidoglycan hydrolase)
MNERGPHDGSKGKFIEITSRAAKGIDRIQEGKAKVQIEIVESGKKQESPELSDSVDPHRGPSVKEPN